MKKLDKPDYPLYNKLVDIVNEQYKANPTDKNMTIVIPKAELEEIVGRDNFKERFKEESRKLMYIRVESKTSIAALCNSLSWNGKELTVDVSKFAIPYLLKEK